jgi:beta-mannosidase
MLTERAKTELPHRNFVRKAQCHSAWDWGPCFLTQGVWLSASIRAFSDAAIQYVAPQVTPLGDSLATWNVGVSLKPSFLLHWYL